jgi:hypothetical protein
MSDTDRQRPSSENAETLDLAKASGVELAEFAHRHGVAVDRLQRCQEYLQTSAPFRGKFELLALVRESDPSVVPALVLRLVRDDGAWIELPSDFPREHLLALLDLLHEG